MSYLKSYRMFMLLLVAVSLMLVPSFTKDAAAKPACVLTGSNMISLATLDSWIETGKVIEAAGGNFAKGYNNGVKDSCGLKKMAILNLTTSGNYASGHPYGAHLWNQSTELRTNRTDGLIVTKRQVATQAMRDVLMDRAGLNKQTVAVIVGNNLQQMGLAYFDLRYWGFPRANIRVVNGVLRDFPGTLTTVVPVNTGDKDFSVCDWEKSGFSAAHDEVRASLAETMSVATDSDPNTIVLDVRSLAEFDGTKLRNDVAFEGHINGAIWNEWVNEATNGSTGAGTQIKDAGTLTAMYNALGITSADTMYVY